MRAQVFVLCAVCVIASVVTAGAESLAPTYASIEAQRARQLQARAETVVELAVGIQLELDEQPPDYTTVADAAQRIINEGCEIHSALGRSEQWHSVAEALFKADGKVVSLDAGEERAQLLAFAREANAPPAPHQGLLIKPVRLVHTAPARSDNMSRLAAIMALVVATCSLLVVGIAGYAYYGDRDNQKLMMNELVAVHDKQRQLAVRVDDLLDSLRINRDDIDHLILRVAQLSSLTRDECGLPEVAAAPTTDKSITTPTGPVNA